MGQEEKGVVAMQVLVPGCTLVPRPQGIEVLESAREAAGKHRLCGACDCEGAGDVLTGIALFAQLQFDRLLVFVDHGDGQTETYDDEIDRRAVGRYRRHPPALAARLIADAAKACAGQLPGLAQRSYGVVGQQAEILRVLTA